MLREFRVDNFKSLLNVVFRPTDINILLGKNNSGKTNLCQALLFLGLSAQQPIQNEQDPRQSYYYSFCDHPLFLRNLYLSDKPEMSFEATAALNFKGEEYIFNYKLSVLTPVIASPEPIVQVSYEKLTVTGSEFNGIALLENNHGEVKLLHQTDFLQGKKNPYIPTSAPSNATMLFRLYDLKTNELANYFKRYILNCLYYDITANSIRSYAHTANSVVLNWDGSNLASALYRLKASDDHLYRVYMDYLKRFDPSIDAINFPIEPSEGYIFMAFADGKRNTMPMRNISNGTLRFMALLYVLLARPKLDFRPVIIIEEPENELFVGELRNVMNLAENNPDSPQLIFTSHSPYFIDLFDKHLNGVFVMKRGTTHSELVQPDPSATQAILDTFPLGEQHFREMMHK